MDLSIRQRDEARMVAYTLEQELRAREKAAEEALKPKEPNFTITPIPEEIDGQDNPTNR